MIHKVGVGLVGLDVLAAAYCMYVGAVQQATVVTAAAVFLGVVLFMTKGAV